MKPYVYRGSQPIQRRKPSPFSAPDVAAEWRLYERRNAATRRAYEARIRQTERASYDGWAGGGIGYGFDAAQGGEAGNR